MVDASARSREPAHPGESERATIRDFLAAFDDVVRHGGRDTARRLLANLDRRAAFHGVPPRGTAITPYLNTIATRDRAAFPGDLALERRLEAIVRWNAMAMVVRANRSCPGIGGHISTFASAATLFEVGFQHVFRGAEHPEGGDLVFFQGHAAPGVYAHAFVEGRLDERRLDGFRRELAVKGGLSSYPHPWLMPDFWEVPTVSMGLAPLMAIYAARFGKYLRARGLVDAPGRVWALLGDGEMDEPESIGALPLAGREHLDNLGFVVSCNLQRLDGPVRGNQRIVDELERVFAAAGWGVVKVLWGGRWAELIAEDRDGLVAARLDDAKDGDLQRWAAEAGETIRAEFFGEDRELAALVEDWDDDDLVALFRDERGGHDLEEVYAAYARAEAHHGPCVILAQTVKGWGLGAAGEALNVSHKATKLDEEALAELRSRLELAIDDDDLAEVPYVTPPPEVRAYAKARREALGGSVPRRRVRAPALPRPGGDAFEKFTRGSDRPATTTMVMARLLAELLRDEELGPLVVPIIPDEARTFGMEALFPQVGIYDPEGAQYETVDADTLTPYAVSETGQLFEEGITEAGAMATALAAGTAYATHGVNTIPFYFFYSMFGFQRVGDLLWAAGDARCRGFLVGATSGRTTLAGEGLQHQDGQSHLLALTHPHVCAYDPAFGYEVATIVQHGLTRMLEHGHDVLYYVTVTNEPGPQPARPDGVEEGIVRGMYRLREASAGGDAPRVQLLASGPMVHATLRAQELLADELDVAADVWSVTSWGLLHRDAIAIAREELLHGEPRRPYVARCLGDDAGAVVAVSDYVKALPSTVAKWIPGEVAVLGTDGFGRSDDRPALREWFEVDERYIAIAALVTLARSGRGTWRTVNEATERLGIDRNKGDPSVLTEDDAWRRR